MYTLGIDLGTSSVKILAVDLDGVIKGESSADYPLYTPHEGWAEQNPEDWWNSTVVAMKNLLNSCKILPNEISGIGLSGQMHGLVALDKNNSCLIPAILWCDQRTQKECDEITNHFGDDGLLQNVGNQALTGFTAPKILWVKNNHPEIFSKI